MGGSFKIKGSTDFAENAPGLDFSSILGSILSTFGSILGARGDFFDKKALEKEVRNLIDFSIDFWSKKVILNGERRQVGHPLRSYTILPSWLIFSDLIGIA